MIIHEKSNRKLTFKNKILVFPFKFKLKLFFQKIILMWCNGIEKIIFNWYFSNYHQFENNSKAIEEMKSCTIFIHPVTSIYIQNTNVNRKVLNREVL